MWLVVWNENWADEFDILGIEVIVISIVTV